MIVDGLGREFRSLRVSLTSACNYACTYCVPGGKSKNKSENELTAGQLIHVINLIKKLSPIEKLKITGGEPLISDIFEEFISSIDKNNYQDIGITTNGQYLAEKAKFIKENGIHRINVSLDTLDPARFRSISRSGDLFSVLSGIEQSLSLGVKLKINMVPLQSRNIDQILPLLEYCLDRGIELRFIELMRMGHLTNNVLHSSDFVGLGYILRLISSRYEFVRAEAPRDSTAMRYLIPGRGTFGVIANESEPFCSACTRLRLSSTGYLHGCLSSEQQYYVGDLVDLSEPDALMQMRERLGLSLRSKQTFFNGSNIIMRAIGG